MKGSVWPGRFKLGRRAPGGQWLVFRLALGEFGVGLEAGLRSAEGGLA